MFVQFIVKSICYYYQLVIVGFVLHLTSLSEFAIIEDLVLGTLTVPETMTRAVYRRCFCLPVTACR